MEDEWLDDFGTQDEYWDDAEEFERNQLALDNEFDEGYDENEDGDEIYPDSDWDGVSIFGDDDSEPPF